MALQVQGEVLSVKTMGDYYSMTVVAAGIAEQTRPGQFVAVAVGGADSGMLLRRAFSIYSVRETGVYGGTVEFIFAVAGKGTAWLAKQRPYDPIDIVGPLGRPFSLPKEPAHCVLVAASVVFTTDDGSYGERGRVSDVLPAVIDRVHADVVYACGPMPMLEAVQKVAGASYGGAGIPTQLAVEESMACGVGVCMTCVLPVIGADDQTRMVRSCVDGPVFAGDRIRWDSLGSVPADAVGATT
jgi:dihydroorotate dehydrogenase electron transfer subunit